MLFTLANIRIMTHAKNKTVIWNFYNIDEIDVASNIGFDLFPGCVIKNKNYNLANIDREDFNVVIINYFFSNQDWPARKMEDLSWADLVIHYTTEIISEPWQEYEKKFTKHFNNKNFITICNGLKHAEEYPRSRVFADTQSFFTRIAAQCRPTLIEKNPQHHRPKLYDVLLGKKDDRKFKIYKNIEQHNLLDRCLLNLWDENKSPAQTIYRSAELDLYDEIKLVGNSTKQIDGLMNGKSGSHNIPEIVYKNTWYSIVSETNSGTTFITEKTTKCLLSGRIFILFGEKGHLAKLRQYGYKTFDPFIDESYDEIDDDDVRMQMAFEQVILLGRTDPMGLYANLYDILVHNQKIIVDQTNRLGLLRQFIGKHIKFGK